MIIITMHKVKFAHHHAKVPFYIPMSILTYLFSSYRQDDDYDSLLDDYDIENDWGEEDNYHKYDKTIKIDRIFFLVWHSAHIIIFPC